VKIIRNINELKSIRRGFPEDLNLGLIPTMGALHDGHISLIKKGKKQCNQVIVSIYVNPTQFENTDDLINYPSSLDKDIDILNALKIDFLFLPNQELMYPNGPIAKVFDLDGIDEKLEGALRPGHFQGVATVVDRLFELIQPNKAYFGLKDFQQVHVIKKLSLIRGRTPEIIACKIIREDSGLAMSSRNLRLNAKELKAAACIFQALKFAEKEVKLFPAPPAALIREMKSIINSTEYIKLEKITFAFSDTLVAIGDPDFPLDHYNKKVHCFISAFAGDIRLIDNHFIC
tara:strand:+ start:29 stop:892 length:864 start_codon:yes stop_codon:yes gene_type:complete